MQSNKSKSLKAPFMNEHVIYNQLNVPNSRKRSEAHYFCRSHSSSFANQGVMHGGKHYSRDPLTGTWFKVEGDRRRDLHDSRSDLAYRYTESKHDKGDGAKTYTVWAAPCPPGTFWREPIAKPQRDSEFGYIDGPVQGACPRDPKDMPDPLSPLTRTASAPNFLPSASTRSKMMASKGSTMSRTGKATMGTTM